ncbi:hypothetical protein GCM10009557_31190 [Virgisporangium ochraceum]
MVAGRWRLELRRGGRHLTIDQWAAATTGDAATMLAHAVAGADALGDLSPQWPALTMIDPAPPRRATVEAWFAFHKRQLKLSELTIPQTNPYRSPVMLVGFRSSAPPHILVCETTHGWFDAAEVPTDTGTAVRGAGFLDCVTSATAHAAAERLLSVLGESEVLITVVDVCPTPGVETPPEPVFRHDLVGGLAAAVELRDDVPVVSEPIVERVNGGFSIRGQSGAFLGGGTEEAGPALLIGVAHPSGRRYVIEYLLPLPGGDLLHDLLQTLGQLLRELGFHDALGLDFGPVPALELVPGGEPADVAARDTFTSQERTLERARMLLPTEAEDGDPASRAALQFALDDLVQSALRDPDEHSRISRLLRVYRVPFDDLLAFRQGRLVLSLIVAELCVEAAFPVVSPSAGPGETAELRHLTASLFAARPAVDVFTDALTSFMRAQVTDHARTRARAVSRVLNLVNEWLVGRQNRPHHSRMTLDARGLTGPQLLRLHELLRRAPWLAWYVMNRTGPRRFRIRLDHAALLEVLGLTRPRTRYVPGENSAKSNPGNWRSVVGQLDLSELLDRYVIDAQVAERLADEPRLLDDLARACEAMYHLPWQARRAVQSLTELGPLADELDVLAGRGAEQRTGSLADVAVVVDAPGGELPPRVCLVNAEGTRRCQVLLGENARFTLAEYAVGVPDAAFYMSAPFALPGTDAQLTLGDGVEERTVELKPRTGLDGGSGSDSEWVDLTLFRGRHEQLTQILGTMHPSATVRAPVAVFGPRGAGKTTLAVHACRQGMSRGWLRGFMKVDLFVDPVDAEGDAYLESLAHVLIDKAGSELDLSIARPVADPATALDQIDLAAAGRPVGIILDEFDRLLSHGADSPLQRLAVRLGHKRWRNLAVIATVQRFYRNAAELETWELIGCPADLSWRDGITYFGPPLLAVEEGVRVIDELRAPVVLPIAFRDFVHRRLGLRPFLWGRLRRRIESGLLMSGGYAVADPAELDRIIDGFIDDVQYLGQPLQESDGVSVSEARRRDLFTAGEKRILACFATSQRKRLSVEEAVRVGGALAVRELQERAYARVADGQLQLAVPLFGEYLRAHALDFEEYVVPA